MMSENPMIKTSAFTGRDTVVLDPGSSSLPVAESAFTEEEWQQMQLLRDYEPDINGTLNRSYVELKAKIQSNVDIKTVGRGKDMAVAIQAGFTLVPKEIVAERAQRVIGFDTDVMEKSRANVCCLADRICEDIIQSNGEEIIATMKCVAFLNAPQINEDLKGDSRLYLTKRTQNSTDVYRCFFYSYGEASEYTAEELTTSIQSRWLECCMNGVFCNTRSKSSLTADWDHRIKREVEAAFVSFGIEDLVLMFHRVNDFTEIQSFINNDRLTETEEKCGEYPSCGSCCSAKCCEHKCCSPCSAFSMHQWKWKFNEKLALELNDLVCREERKASKLLDQMTYDPYAKSTEPMVSYRDEVTSTRRFHTLNLVYMDSLMSGSKKNAVIVLNPNEPTTQAISFVCRITKLLDEHRSKIYVYSNEPSADIESGRVMSLHSPQLMYRDWVMKLNSQLRNPYDENRHLMPDGKSFAKLGFSATVDLKHEKFYYYNGLWLMLLALIGMIVCFASGLAAAIVTGVFDLFYLIQRLYYFNVKVTTMGATMGRDIFVGFLFLLMGVIIAGLHGGGGSAAAAFSILLALFSLGGAASLFFARH